MSTDPTDRNGTRATNLFEELKALFYERKWVFSEASEVSVLVSELAGDTGRLTLSAQVIEDAGLVLFHTVCPVLVPPARREAMTEFLTRVNHGLSLGNFELDLEDGEIRCKTVLVVEDELSPALVERLIQANGRTMERFLPSITAVAAGDEAPSIARLH